MPFSVFFFSTSSSLFLNSFLLPPKPSTPQPKKKKKKKQCFQNGAHSIDEKIKKLDAQLVGHREAIRKARPGAQQDAAKRRALAVLKQKKMLEAQRDQLYNQQFNMEQTSFALESVKDSVATVQAMKAAGAELKTAMKDKNLVRRKSGFRFFFFSLFLFPFLLLQSRGRWRSTKLSRFYFLPSFPTPSSSQQQQQRQQQRKKKQDISGIESLQDDMADLMDSHAEIQEALGQTFGLPDDVDEDELLGELDALEDELAAEASAAPAAGEAAAAPSYLSEEPTDLPAAPARPVAVGGGGSGSGAGTAVAQRN